MQEKMEDVLRRSTIFRRLTPDDRQRLAALATVREFDKGTMLFSEGDGSDLLYMHIHPSGAVAAGTGGHDRNNN